MLSVTATDLQRLMNCNGSLMLEGEEPSGYADTTVKDEGVAAHWLVEQVHKGEHAIEEYVDRKAPNGVYITAEMVEYLEEYLKDIERYQIEVDTSFSGDGWEIRGRADRVIYDEFTKTLGVADLKYGWSLVEPKDNWTLVSHALGYIQKHNIPVDVIVLTIYQPRPYHAEGRIRSVTLSAEELTACYTKIHQTLSNPSDMLVTGEQCTNCPVMTVCPAARKAQMNAIDVTEKAYDDKIDNNQLSFELSQLERAIKVLKERQKAYNDLGLQRMKKGQIIDGYAMETDLTNRVIKSNVTIDFVKSLTNVSVVKEQLITPAQMEKAGVCKELVASLTERRVKGVKIVKSDANAKAKKLFEKKGN